MSGYSADFYDELAGTAIPSARRIVPFLMDLFAPASVVDFGCGNGGWLSVFRESGVETILGLDGHWVDVAQLRIPAERFRRAELDKPVAVEGAFDLAMSLEVAEHLPETRAPEFVAELCARAPVVLFSAAIPEQGGLHHINERWPDYWTALFAARGYRSADILRLRVWNDPQVTWWYKQNLLLFVREDIIAANEKLLAAMVGAPAEPLSLVHPDRFLEEARRSRPRFGRWLKMAPDAIRRSLAAKKR